MSKNDLDVKKIRELFPIFKQKINRHKLVYLDSVSTAQMPQSVIDAIVNYYAMYKANVGRGIYRFAEKSTEQFEAARRKIAHFIGAEKKEIIFTSGATEGINRVAQTWAEQNVNKGDEIVVSEIEHHSNFIPWQQLAIRKGAVLKIVPVNEKGFIDLDIFKTYLSSRTKLVAMIHTSNVLGITNNLKPMIQAAHAVGAKFLVDAAQSVVHQKIDVQDLGCDFLVFSGHKLFGPTGIGILYFKFELFDQSVLALFGGGMVFSTSEQETIFKPMPYSFEAGTQPIAQVIGLSAVIDFLETYINYVELQKHETYLTKMLAKELKQFADIKVLSHIPGSNEHGHLVSFVSERYHAHDIAAYLDQYGIAVRAGNHCVQPFHQKLGVNASVRASFSMYNTEKEVGYFIDCLRKLYVSLM